MKILIVGLGLIVFVMGAQVYSCIAVHELPPHFLDQRKRYYSKFMEVGKISGKLWRAGEFNCVYEKVSWVGDESFIAEESRTDQNAGALILGVNSVWQPHINALWSKGPAVTRKPSLKRGYGDVKHCLALSFGRKSNVIKKARNEDTWHLDIVSNFIVISNSTKTVERISTSLRDY